MAQLNDLLVTGQAAVTASLSVGGEIKEQGTPLNEKYLSKQEAETIYITATLSGTTLTITIPT